MVFVVGVPEAFGVLEAFEVVTVTFEVDCLVSEIVGVKVEAPVALANDLDE